jgi:2,4-diaminopentanoate dehydrogenase
MSERSKEVSASGREVCYLTLRCHPSKALFMKPAALGNENTLGQVQRKPRVVIYGVGFYGMEAVRILAKKGWPIVAAVNRAGPKIGQDLGRLAGLNEDLGVIVQDCETADYAALGADIALVVQTERLSLNLVAYQRLLGAGINVICHGSESYFPQGADPELAEKIDALAKRAGVTFTGTGIWDFSRIWSGILIAGPCTELRSLTHHSLTNAELANERMMRAYGVDMTQAEFAEKVTKVPGQLGELYKGIPHHVMHALGFTVTNVIERREPVLSDHPVWCRILDRSLEPGISLGLRIIVTVETTQGPTASAHIELRILAKGEAEHMMWAVDGRPPSKIRVDRADGVHTSAACMVNRIPDVITAPPGVRLISQLGPLRPPLI